MLQNKALGAFVQACLAKLTEDALANMRSYELRSISYVLVADAFSLARPKLVFCLVIFIVGFRPVSPKIEKLHIK